MLNGIVDMHMKCFLQFDFNSNITSIHKRKRKRSDSVLRQKPLYQQTIQKSKAKHINTAKTRLHNDREPALDGKLVWRQQFNLFTGFQPSYYPQVLLLLKIINSVEMFSL